MQKKVMRMQDAVSLVKEGQLLGIGGNSLYRNPSAFCFELARRGLKGLQLCGTSHGIASDVLCAVGSVEVVYFGFFGFELEYGLAPGMRKGCQEGKIRAMEGSCPAIAAALRGGAAGVPFVPVHGMSGSQLIAQSPEMFQIMESPFDWEKTVVIKSLTPDWAIIHVHEADEFGNARIDGSLFVDPLHTRAAKKTILTAEKIVPGKTFTDNPTLTGIPYFLVEVVVEAPGGAKPGCCYGLYDTVDAEGMKKYQQAVRDGTLADFLHDAARTGA